MEGEAIYILKFHPELENNLKVNIRNTDNRLMQNNSLCAYARRCGFESPPRHKRYAQSDGTNDQLTVGLQSQISLPEGGFKGHFQQAHKEIYFQVG